MEKGTRSTSAEMYRSVFEGASGQWVLNDILERAGVGQKLFAQDQLKQNMNVATHDFAISIRDLAAQPKEQ